MSSQTNKKFVLPLYKPHPACLNSEFESPPSCHSHPPFATAGGLCQAFFMSWALSPPHPPPPPHSPPITPISCSPLVTPWTTLLRPSPSQHPVWSAGTGGGAASLASALPGPHPQPAASISFRSLPGLHCRGMHIQPHHTILAASYKLQAVVAMANSAINTSWAVSQIDWCCMLHLKASWGCVRTDVQKTKIA